MKLSPKSTEIYSHITQPTTKLGDLKKFAREIKKDHEMAMELYKDEIVPRGCTPSYLPKFIAIEVAKLKK